MKNYSRKADRTYRRFLLSPRLRDLAAVRRVASTRWLVVVRYSHIHSGPISWISVLTQLFGASDDQRGGRRRPASQDRVYGPWKATNSPAAAALQRRRCGRRVCGALKSEHAPNWTKNKKITKITCIYESSYKNTRPSRLHTIKSTPVQSDKPICHHRLSVCCDVVYIIYGQRNIAN